MTLACYLTSLCLSFLLYKSHYWGAGVQVMRHFSQGWAGQRPPPGGPPPFGEGDFYSPLSPQVPFFRKRQHHACPCLPNLLCSRGLDGRYRCSTNLKNINF